VTLLPASARDGAISTMVPQLEAGQIVTIPRERADTIVTDRGIAPLLGRSVRERAEVLIEVAHPDHQDWLRDEARRLYGP
jgi:4-hydroxybutyrate CoA-transferase